MPGTHSSLYAIFSSLLVHSRSGDNDYSRLFWPVYKGKPSCQESPTETLSRSYYSVVSPVCEGGAMGFVGMRL